MPRSAPMLALPSPHATSRKLNGRRLPPAARDAGGRTPWNVPSGRIDHLAVDPPLLLEQCTREVLVAHRHRQPSSRSAHGRALCQRRLTVHPGSLRISRAARPQCLGPTTILRYCQSIDDAEVVGGGECVSVSWALERLVAISPRAWPAAGHETRPVARGPHLARHPRAWTAPAQRTGRCPCLAGRGDRRPARSWAGRMLLFTVKLYDAELALDAALPMVASSPRVS